MTSIEDYINRQYQVQVTGRVEVDRELIYPITYERKLTHPIISAICQFAQHDMFGGESIRKMKP